MKTRVTTISIETHEILQVRYHEAAPVPGLEGASGPLPTDFVRRTPPRFVRYLRALLNSPSTNVTCQPHKEDTPMRTRRFLSIFALATVTTLSIPTVGHASVD